MKISFVIPAYNEEASIGPCLISIQKELEHTTDPSTGKKVEAEVVVVNNASTDNTRAVALAVHGVRVVDEPHKGLVRARKAGFDATTGELVANIDSDTVMPEGWLTTTLQEFAKHKELVALSGPYVYYDLSPVMRGLVYPWYFFGWLLFGFRIQGGNFIIKRSAWEKVGGYDTSIEFYGEDTDVAQRLKKVGKVKWSWKLKMNTSGRRLAGEGLIKTTFHYASNLLWITLFGKPFTQKYIDVRPK